MKKSTEPKVKLSKEQKHYVGILEQVDAGIEKKKAALERAEARITKAQAEALELRSAIQSLEKMKSGAEALLENTPPPPQFAEVFKTIFEHHYHYHYPSQPTPFPQYPVYQPWWTYTTSAGSLNSIAINSLIVNGVPASSSGIGSLTSVAGNFTMASGGFGGASPIIVNGETFPLTTR